MVDCKTCVLVVSIASVDFPTERECSLGDYCKVPTPTDHLIENLPVFLEVVVIIHYHQRKSSVQLLLVTVVRRATSRLQALYFVTVDTEIRDGCWRLGTKPTKETRPISRDVVVLKKERVCTRHNRRST